MSRRAGQRCPLQGRGLCTTPNVISVVSVGSNIPVHEAHPRFVAVLTRRPPAAAALHRKGAHPSPIVLSLSNPPPPSKHPIRDRSPQKKKKSSSSSSKKLLLFFPLLRSLSSRHFCLSSFLFLWPSFSSRQSPLPTTTTTTTTATANTTQQHYHHSPFPIFGLPPAFHLHVPSTTRARRCRQIPS